MKKTIIGVAIGILLLWGSAVYSMNACEVYCDHVCGDDNQCYRECSSRCN